MSLIRRFLHVCLLTLCSAEFLINSNLYDINGTKNSSVNLTNSSTNLTNSYNITNLTSVNHLETNETSQNASNIIQYEPNCNDIPNSNDSYCIHSFAKNLLNKNISLLDTALEMSAILSKPKDIFIAAQEKYNATDEILDKFDALIMREADKDFQLFVQNNLIVLTFDINATKIAGIAIYEKPDTITNEIIYRHTAPAEILNQGKLLMAAYLPEKLLKQIETSSNHTVVAITMFFTANLFEETNSRSKFGGKVHVTPGVAIRVLVPDFVDKFETPLRLIYRINRNDFNSRDCAQWVFGSQIKGEWVPDVKAPTCGNIEICEYDHSSHFSLLLTNATSLEKVHKKSLDVITLIGTILSISGILGIFVAALFCKDWRNEKINQFLLHYALVTFLVTLALCFSGIIKEKSMCDSTTCFWSGTILHYLVLVQFLWVLIMCAMQCKTFIPTLTSNLICISAAWLTPALLIIVFGRYSYDSYFNNTREICYGGGLLPFVLDENRPILILVTLNFVLFAKSIKHFIFKDDALLASHVSTNEKQNLVKIFSFYLIFTWFFNILSKDHTFFTYLFCFCATFQGFISFCLILVFDCEARKFYQTLFDIRRESDVQLQ